jgi:putative cardiolipin synthase
VRVRLLLDDLGVGAKDDSVFRLLDAHPLVSVVLFNPIALREARKLGMLSDPRRLNRRMHNKSMTADSTVTVVGGRNIGDEYFSLNELVNFADLDVLAIGPVASQVSESFDAYWNSSAAFPINAFHDQPVTAEELAQGRADLEQAVARNAAEYYQAMAATPLGLKIAAGQLNFYWAEITALYDTPNKARLDQPDEAAGDPGPDLLLQQLGNLLGHSKSELLIVSPYFVPGKQGTAALVAAAQRGIKVRVVTNSLASTDVAAVHAGYKDSRRDLLEGGVQMYEMKPALDAEQSGKLSFTGSSAASLHAKLFVIDLERLFVGSMNLDPRSVQLNTEIGLLIDSSEMAGDVGENIKRMLDTACYSVQLQPKRPDRPDGRQQMVWIETREGKSVRHDQEPQTSAWQRFKVGFIGIFPIDSQL